MKEYEIWLGYYHLGQGDHGSTEPKMVAKVTASSFKIACCIYEHQSAIDSLKERMERNDPYIEDAHFGHWYYNPKINANGWTGFYYESREAAQESFK